MKQCKRCEQDKPDEDFIHGRRSNGYLVRRLICKACKLEYKRELYHRSDNYRKNDNARAEKRRVSLHPSGLTNGRVDELRKKFKLTPESYFALRAEQNGLCAICGDPLLDTPRGMHVDHDHGTGRVRGILCVGCNSGLGGFKDSPERLEAAIRYLRGRSDEVIDTSSGGVGLQRSTDHSEIHEK